MSLNQAIRALQWIAEKESVTPKTIDWVHKMLVSHMGQVRAIKFWQEVGTTPPDLPSVDQIRSILGVITAMSPAPVLVTLSSDECLFGASVGIKRHLQDLSEGRQPRFGDKEIMAIFNIVGAWGEQAAAKYIGCEWTGSLGDFKAQDAGPYQVRTSMRDCGLNIYDWDESNGSLDRWFISVRGAAPTLKILGCLYGRDAIRPEFRVRGGYFVGASRLKHIHYLPQS